MSPTTVEADHYNRWGNPKTTFHTRDRILGTVDRDTMRQIALFTTSEHHERTVYLDVYNLTDRARVFLKREDNPPPTPKPLQATLNDEPVDTTSWDNFHGMDITEGQKFRIWFKGEKGETWEERDQMLGSAEVTWTPR